jgi:anhydro-N-acetylmuramic acid kinase
MSELYIGLMSGTSADGIDAAMVDFNAAKPVLIAHHFTEFSVDLRRHILSLSQPGHDEITRLGELDHLLGKAFAQTVNDLLKKTNATSKDVLAIGSHGQTIRHNPRLAFTLQIGDPNIIAADTGITTIADFRRRDMAHGGQGAPLVPAFHQTVLSNPLQDTTVVNIGGVANITFLPCDTQQSILGFDTGPGNNLMDAWTQMHLQKMHDKNGEWARQGVLSPDLLTKLLDDPYFKAKPPKSTGPEYFNLAWLQKHLTPNLNEVDVQTTLAELTATSITHAVKNLMSKGEVLICGGGIHNQYLMQLLTALLKPLNVLSTEAHGVHPDWMEAMAFAWLAKQTLAQKTGNIIQVTGAKQTAILGGIYLS